MAAADMLHALERKDYARLTATFVQMADAAEATATSTGHTLPKFSA